MVDIILFFYSKRMTAKKCLEHSWLTKAKRATAKVKGKKNNDSCCESLSSNDSPYDISQDSTSSLDVSPVSSASSSFSPAAGKPSDDETLSITPVKSSQPSLNEKVSSPRVEKDDNSDVENLMSKKSIKNTVKEKDSESVKKSSPVCTPTGSFGSSRSVKSSSVATKRPLSTTLSRDNIAVSKSASNPTLLWSLDTTDSVFIPHSQSTTSITSGSVNVNDVDTSQVVLRRKSRGKVSTDPSNKNEDVRRRNKVNPESLPNYSRDSYRRNSMNFSESNDIDVMEFLRNGSLPGSTDHAWPPPSPQPSPSSNSNRSTLHPISETNGRTKLIYRDKSPKISFDAQMALLDQLEEESSTSKQSKKPTEDTIVEVCEHPSSPKIPMEAIEELQSELKIGLGWPEKPQRPSDEEQKSSSPTNVSQPQSQRPSSPKISMEAILDILQNPECDVKIESVEDTHTDLKRKLSQPKDEQALTAKPKNLERTTEWKTLPRRRSSAKPSYIVQSKPIKMDNTKPSYNPTGPFQFLPNPSSRLVDRRGSLPVNAVGGKLCGSSSTSQLVSRPLNSSQSSHNSTSASLERSITPLSFYNTSNPSSRSNSPSHCSPSFLSCRAVVSPSPSKISHWKSCEDLDN